MNIFEKKKFERDTFRKLRNEISLNQRKNVEKNVKRYVDLFVEEYNNAYNESPNQLSFLSYDTIGLIYFLLYNNNFELSKDIFYKKNKFKGKIGIFEIEKNIITHQLNFYSVQKNEFKKIF